MNMSALSELNIFEILGVTDVSPEDKEALLGELQDAIWEQLVDSEIADTMTETDLVQFEAILNEENMNLDEKRSQLFAVLNDRIPNLDEKLAESTNRMKHELLESRIDGLSEYFAQDAVSLAKVNEAHDVFEAGNYAHAISLLNELHPRPEDLQ